MTSWAAPCTGGEDGILPDGEEFVVANDPPEGATAVYCDPVRYDQLHAYFVSKDREAAVIAGTICACRSRRSWPSASESAPQILRQTNRLGETRYLGDGIRRGKVLSEGCDWRAGPAP